MNRKVDWEAEQVQGLLLNDILSREEGPMFPQTKYPRWDGTIGIRQPKFS